MWKLSDWIKPVTGEDLGKSKIFMQKNDKFTSKMPKPVGKWTWGCQFYFCRESNCHVSEDSMPDVLFTVLFLFWFESDHLLG